jgi:hypothetical protein
MKSWKIVVGTAFLFFAIALSTLVSSCNDPCNDRICKNGGVCRDGECICASGFEGPLCESKMYEKFIGTWDGTYRCDGGIPTNETIIISPNTGLGPDDVVIYNLFAQNITLEGTILNTDITIKEKTINGSVYNGLGYVDSGSIITLFITEKSNLGTFNCVFNGELYQSP